MVNFEHNLHIALVFQLLTLIKYMLAVLRLSCLYSGLKQWIVLTLYVTIDKSLLK